MVEFYRDQNVVLSLGSSNNCIVQEDDVALAGLGGFRDGWRVKTAFHQVLK